MPHFILALFTLLVCSSPLLAVIEDHFKKITDKKDGCSLRNIDYIYLINLEQRPEKFAKCLAELAPWGIAPYRFPAVNGWQIPLTVLQDLGVAYEPWMRIKRNLWGTFYPSEKEGEPVHEVMSVVGRNYFSHCMSRGAIGICLSHLSILQDAYDAGYETIWVMEDDIQVLQNPHKLSDLVEELDKEVGKGSWDILFTDQDTKNSEGKYVPCRGYAKRPNFDPCSPERFFYESQQVGSFYKIEARYGAYSMILRRSGIEKILNFLKTYKIFLPYDMEFYLCDGIQIYTVKEDVVSTLPNAISDNGGPNYLKNECYTEGKDEMVIEVMR